MTRLPCCRREGAACKVILTLFAFVIFHCLMLSLENKSSAGDVNLEHENRAMDVNLEQKNRAGDVNLEHKNRAEDVGSLKLSKESVDLTTSQNTSTNSPKGENNVKNGGQMPGIKTYAFKMKNNNKKKSSKSKRKKSFQEDKVVDLDDIWTDEKKSAQAKVFEERSKVVSDRCEEMADDPALHPNISTVHGNIRWVPKYKLIWCPVYKAGSTTWMSNLLLLAGVKPTSNSFHKQVRKLYPPPEDPDEREHLLQTSFRMLIVRHPLERLLSAYRDKMLRQNQFERLSNIVRTTYRDPKAKKNDDRPTFRQFLMYIKDTMTKFWKSGGTSRVNPHWQPVWWTCSPCDIQYDHIAHMETLTLDQEYIIRKAQLKDIAVNAHTHSSNQDSYKGTDEATKDYFSQIPKKLLRQVADLYRVDFELFGYSPDSFIQMGTDESI